MSATNAFAAFASASTNTSTNFSDVTESHRYREAIEFASEEGVVRGYDDGSFQPERTLNRAELLKMTIEANFEEEEIEEYSSERCFSDIGEDVWYTKYVCFAKDRGIVDGYEDQTFRPEQEINTAEAIKITMDAFEYEYEEEGGDTWYEGVSREASELRLIPPDVSSFDEEFKRGQMADLVTRAVKEKEDSLDSYLGEGSVKIKTYEMIERDIEVSDVNWGWKLATSAEDAYDFINGFGDYSEPRAVKAIAGTDTGFYVFYRNDLEGDSSWGWKLAPNEEDASDFLNRLGAYSGEPKDQILVAKKDGDYYIFYNGKDENANWKWKKSTDIDDMYNYFNRLGDYNNNRSGIIAGSSDEDITMFYRSDEEEGDWGWKKATTITDAYNFLNGFGAYVRGQDNIRIFAEDDNKLYIFYDNSGSQTSSFTTALPTCHDSDGGNDIYTKGELDLYTPSWGNQVVSEYCVDVYGDRTEFGGHVEELVCLENNDTYSYEHERTECLYGCSKGACLEEGTMSYTGPIPYSMGVNDYSDHKDFSQTANMANAYLNIYNVTPVSQNNYHGILRETISTGEDKSAKFYVDYGEIVSFVGFKELENAEAATAWTFTAPPNKHFGYKNKLCQINYLDSSSIMTNSYGESCSLSGSTPYQD